MPRTVLGSYISEPLDLNLFRGGGGGSPQTPLGGGLGVGGGFIGPSNAIAASSIIGG